MGRYTILRAAEAALAELTAEFGFTGFASVLSGLDIVLLRVLQSTHPLRYVREAGTRLPAARTAMGHVLLARLGDAAVEARFRGVEGLDIAGLLAQLAAIRRQGFVVTGSVLTAAATTVAAAVNDSGSGGPLALAYPDSAVSSQLQARMTEALLARTRRLECGGGQADILQRDMTPV